jgi:indole-3-glycerol phosphate synthase
MNSSPESVLNRIIDKKRLEVEALRAKTDPDDLKRRAGQSPPGRDFTAALRDCPRVPVIAEIKKASPSAGTLKQGIRVDQWAENYQAGGAAALSVVTDGPFFGGDLGDFEEARGAVDLPALRKDFIIDPIQLYQSKVAGADAVLLIVAALAPERLRDLFHEALDLGLTPLVEVHCREELDDALALDPPLIGINNRNLATLQVSLETCLALRPLIGPETLVVGESGIKGPEDIRTLRAGGIDAFLVGTTLMCAPDPCAMLNSLCLAGG